MLAEEVVIEFCGRCHRVPSKAVAVIRSALRNAPELSAGLDAAMRGERVPVVLSADDAQALLRAADDALAGTTGLCAQLDALIAELRARFLAAEHAFLPPHA